MFMKFIHIVILKTASCTVYLTISQVNVFNSIFLFDQFVPLSRVIYFYSCSLCCILCETVLEMAMIAAE